MAEIIIKKPGTIDSRDPTEIIDPTKKADPEEWSLANLPPEGHDDCGKFFYQLYQDAKAEKERLLKPETWLTSYNYFKGNHWDRASGNTTKVSVNLFFSNVIRTVANIVNRNPVAEIKSVDLTGNGDLIGLWTKKMEKWWIDSNQHKKLRTSVINNEVYGATFEKPVWDKQMQRPDTVVVDPFAAFPAPGYWEDIALDCPYFAHAVPQQVAALKAKYKNDEITSDDFYYEMGQDREDHTPVQANATVNTTYKVGTQTFATTTTAQDKRTGYALEIEVWVRDRRLCPCSGKQLYPGGVRCVTLVNSGDIVLKDEKNPMINFEMGPEKYETNFLYKRLPFFKANSYADTSSIWGFSALDQTYELAVKIEELLSMAIAYHMRSAYGIMLVSKRSGIKRSQLSNKPGLVLFPDSDVDQIKFVPLPSLPASYFNLIDTLIELHDRIYMVQDADRGQAPSGVVAASAIVALQEKNAVLIQEKIDSIEKLVESRGNSAIALFQMHGHMPESIQLKGETFNIKGTDLAGIPINYIVQAGSLMNSTKIEQQQQSAELFREGAIDVEALLTDLGYQGKDAVLERKAENELEQAMSLLVQAGLPEEMAGQLFNVLKEAQYRDDVKDQGQGNTKQGNAAMAGGKAMPAPGTPVSKQGKTI